jgi:hypothetical protein
MRPLFIQGAYTPQWQHGLKLAVPGYIDQREQMHPVFRRKAVVTRFRPLAAGFKATPMVDAHRIDFGTVMFELWGIERADPLGAQYQAQAWRVWLQDPSTRP